MSQRFASKARELCIAVCLGWTATAAGQTQMPVFRGEVRLVEVYATVFDSHERHIPDLAQNQFEVRDNGQVQSLAAFEPITSRLTCAILLDRTGSMEESLPVMKNAVLSLIDQLRADDRIAIYTFNTSLTLAQDFTSNKTAAKRAVLQTTARGATALFDALSVMAEDLSRQNGKKAIVVFTDGSDNSSILSADAATRRARSIGVPVYSVAQGEALHNKSLLKLLKGLSEWTAGEAYLARKSNDIEKIFQDITKDLQYTYMLAYAPPPTKDRNWRTIQVAVKGIKNARVRTRTGYFPQ